jgi:hypothetical protein
VSLKETLILLAMFVRRYYPRPTTCEEHRWRSHLFPRFYSTENIIGLSSRRSERISQRINQTMKRKWCSHAVSNTMKLGISQAFSPRSALFHSVQFDSAYTWFTSGLSLRRETPSHSIPSQIHKNSSGKSPKALGTIQRGPFSDPPLSNDRLRSGCRRIWLRSSHHLNDDTHGWWLPHHRTTNQRENPLSHQLCINEISNEYHPRFSNLFYPDSWPKSRFETTGPSTIAGDELNRMTFKPIKY